MLARDREALIERWDGLLGVALLDRRHADLEQRLDDLLAVVERLRERHALGGQGAGPLVVALERDDRAQARKRLGHQGLLAQPAQHPQALFQARRRQLIVA